MKNYKIYKLTNGLVVGLERMPVQTLMAKGIVNFGPVNEKEGEEGISHFLEHCLVRGGSEKYDAETARQKMENFYYSNAITSQGRIAWFSQMLSEDLESWLDVSSDHLFRPRLEEERVESERRAVLREISDYKTGSYSAQERELNNLFYRGHPKGIFILGKEAVIKGATVKDLRDFHSRGFHSNNMDLILVGRLPDNTEELIEKYFGKISGGPDTRTVFPELAPFVGTKIFHIPAPNRINEDNPEESSARLQMHFSAPSEQHPDTFAIEAMSKILGGNANSYLYKNLRERRGLAYSVHSSYNGAYNAGELIVNTLVDAKRIEEATAAIFEEMQRLKTERVDQKVLDSIKRNVRFNLAKSFESPEGHSNELELILSGRLSFERVIKQIEGITPEKIFELANQHLPGPRGNYILVIRDPLAKEKDF